MAFSISTGLANHLMTGGSLKDAIDGKVIRIYAGPIPATADAAIDPASHTLLCTLSNGGNGMGVTMGNDPANGIISKASGETWKGEIVDSGVASFFRFVDPEYDDGAESNQAVRIQGSVGVLNADFLVGDTMFAAGDEQRCDSCNMGIPV
jgi:hypothetical protein